MGATRGLFGRQVAHDSARVVLNSAGSGSIAVSFPAPFRNPPAVLVVAHLGNTGTFAASSITKDGFILSVTGSSVVSVDLDVVYVAVEKT